MADKNGRFIGFTLTFPLPVSFLNILRSKQITRLLGVLVSLLFYLFLEQTSYKQSRLESYHVSSLLLQEGSKMLWEKGMMGWVFLVFYAYFFLVYFSEFLLNFRISEILQNFFSLLLELSLKFLVWKLADLDGFLLDLNSEDQVLSVECLCVCKCFDCTFKNLFYLGCHWKIDESSNLYSIIQGC